MNTDTTQAAQCHCLNLKPSLSVDANQNAMWVHDAQCGLPPYPADQEDVAEVEQQIRKSWADEQREVEAIRERAATDYRHISDEQYTPMLADIRTLLRALNLVTAFWEGAEKELTEVTSHTEAGQAERKLRSRLIHLAARLIKERSHDPNDPFDETFRLCAVEAREIADALATASALPDEKCAVCGHNNVSVLGVCQTIIRAGETCDCRCVFSPPPQSP